MSIFIKTAIDLVRHARSRDRGTTAGSIYDDLRQRILSLELPPGTSLLRAELAEKYHVSQTPLRDALQQLERDDLVRTIPQSKTLVTRIKTYKIHEAYFLRVALETEVIRQLARKECRDLLESAQSVVDLQRAVSEDPNQIRLFQELDEYFHLILFEEAGLENLYKLVQSQSGHLDRVRRLQVHSKSKIVSILAGHEAILNAIEDKNEAAAIISMRDHLLKPQDWFEEIRVKHENYFS